MASLEQSVARHKALAHPVRQRLLAMLRPGGLCVCQMTAVLELAVSTVSAHLSELKRAGLLEERKDGRWVRYSWTVNPELRRVLEELTDALSGDPTVVTDRRLVKRLRRVSMAELCRVELDLGRVGIRRSEAATTR
jgi:ArsR family transcriptional regulator